MEIFKDTRNYPITENGRYGVMKVNYEITFKDGKVQNVFNEFNHTVRKGSEVFSYYSNKFNGTNI